MEVIKALPTSLITVNRFLMNQFKEIILLYDEILIYSRYFFKNWEAYINKRLNCMIEICVLLFTLRMSFWNVKNNTFVFTINKIIIQFTNLPKRDGTPNSSLKRSESSRMVMAKSVTMTPRDFPLQYLRVAVSVDKTGRKREYIPFTRNGDLLHIHDDACFRNYYFYLLFNCTTVYYLTMY